MKILKWLKRKLTPPPDVYYVTGPSCQLTKDLSDELKKLKEKADKRKLVDTINRTQDILKDFESSIHAEKADARRSPRG